MEIVIGIIVLGGILVLAYNVLNKEKADGSHPLDSVTKESGVKLGPEPEPTVPPAPEPTPAPAPVKANKKPVAKKQPAKVAAKTAKKKSPAKTTGA